MYGDCHSYSIGKGAGYKQSELSALSDGSTLVVGGKELEVCMYVVPASISESSLCTCIYM